MITNLTEFTPNLVMPYDKYIRKLLTEYLIDIATTEEINDFMAGNYPTITEKQIEARLDAISDKEIRRYCHNFKIIEFDTDGPQVVLIQKPSIIGLTLSDIEQLIKLSCGTEFYSLEIEAADGQECTAMGFITTSAAESLEYDYSNLNLVISNILADKELENTSELYYIDKLCVYLTY